jgi:hypothetical protein
MNQKRIVREVSVRDDVEVDITDEVNEAVKEELKSRVIYPPNPAAPEWGLKLDRAICKVRKADSRDQIIAILLETIGDDVLTREAKDAVKFIDSMERDDEL